jgi:hypothetical protein
MLGFTVAGSRNGCSGHVGGLKLCVIAFSHGVSYKYSITIVSVYLTVSEFTYWNMSSEIMQAAKRSSFLGF